MEESNELIIKHISTEKVLFRAITVNLGAFFFGYCIGVLNMSEATLDIVLNIDNSSNKDLWNGLLNAFFAFGALVASALTPSLLKIISPKKALLLSDLLGIVGSFLAIFANLGTFSLHRFVVGLVVGVNSTLVPIYNK